MLNWYTALLSWYNFIELVQLYRSGTTDSQYAPTMEQKLS